jgi:hypothetical protein
MVEFGDAIEVTPLMLQQYRQDKRKACGELLELIEKRLRAVSRFPLLANHTKVTLNFPSYK